MHNNKIYSVLQHFDKIEQNRLRKYVISPYFNKNQALIQLFERLLKEINKPNGQALTREKMWAELYPDKLYDDVRFRKLCSDLLKLVEGFLAQETFDRDSMYKANFLMEAVTRRKLDKLYQTCINTTNRLSEKYPYRAADYYHHQYKFQAKRYELEFELQRTRKSNIDEIIQHLDNFYLSEKLKLTCDILSRKAFMARDYNNLFIEEITSLLKTNQLDDIPPIAIYYQIYLTQVESENVDHYYELKELLRKHGDLFPSNEAKVIYEAAMNYCIQSINRGNADFLKELFDLHETLLNNGLMLVNGELSPWNFLNIVIIALRLREFDWTEQFIHDFKEKIPLAFRDNAVTFNLGRLFFYKKEYDKVVEYLREVEYEEVSYNLASKAMLMITYYDTDEIEPLYSLMDSFRTFLNRKKEILPQRRRNYLDLIRFLKMLTKTNPGDKKAIEKLRSTLAEMKSIAADRKWLKEKIEELE